nr:hypothetical protein [Microbacterium bovistercoris]
MTVRTAADLLIVRRRDRPLELIDDTALRRAIESRQWIRITAGAYARTDDWNGLKPIEQHAARVHEVVRRLVKPAAVSHLAAAAVHGIDVLGTWPRRVDVTTRRTTGGRSGGAVRRHALGLDDVERTPFGAHEITSAAQTALDLARYLPFIRAVSAVDQAIWLNRPGGPLTTIAEILALLDRSEPRRGDARARRVIEFANPLAANVRESQSRVVIAQLGFPTPRLQERRTLPSGRLVFGDFYFPDADHWGEVDGRGKYLSPEFGVDRNPAAIVIDEKNRENEIRREVRGFSRWEAKDADDPRRLWDILTGDGLPCAKPRP